MPQEITNPQAVKNCAGCRLPVKAPYMLLCICSDCLNFGAKTPLGKAVMEEWHTKKGG